MAVETTPRECCCHPLGSECPFSRQIPDGPHQHKCTPAYLDMSGHCGDPINGDYCTGRCWENGGMG